jgi:hypothetical protein
VVSPNTRREVATEVLAQAFALVGHGRAPRDFALGVSEIIGSLLRAAAENRKTISDTIETLLQTKVLGSNEAEAILAFEIALHLPNLIHAGDDAPTVLLQDVLKYWTELSNHVLLTDLPKFQRVAKGELDLSQMGLYGDLISMGDLLGAHGLPGLFGAPVPKILVTPTGSSVLVSRSLIALRPWRTTPR